MVTKSQKIFGYTAFGLFMFSSLTLFTNAQMATTTNDGSSEPEITRRQYIQNWRHQTSELQQKINALNNIATSSIAMPVLFGVELTNIFPNFGDPRSNGRSHKGEDIMAVKGTPIVSPTEAVVIRTEVGASEGNTVYTANPGGETFVYMHLDKFAEGIASGMTLHKGSLVGYVGNTGNAAGGASHLHFEVHDNNGVAMDPFPRLTSTLTLQEKISDLSNILTQTSDPNALAQMLVINFRSTFNNALTSGIVLPQLITTYLGSLPNTTPPTGSTLPAGDMTIGSKGVGVVDLQEYLIAKNTGPLAQNLAYAGATGNFGAITRAALVEYQIRMGITPADGYYGASTRAVVLANPVTTSTTTPSTPTLPAPSTTPSTILRDLSKNMVGTDVLTLQKFLNTHGYVVATSGAGSLGNETTYFGAATEAAVIKFQLANSISPAVGYVGPLTRAKLTSLGI